MSTWRLICIIFWCGILVIVLVWGFISITSFGITADHTHNNPKPLRGPLVIDVDYSHARKIPDTMFGIEIEEVNHALSGGLWAELVRNRGFEEMGHAKPARLEYWGIIGSMSHINVSMDLTSCFEHNKVALRMDVLSSHLPYDAGVGIYNSGYRGMNIVEGHTYRVTLYSRSTNTMNVTVAFTSFDGFHILASTTILVADNKWKKAEMVLKATRSNPKGKLELTTTTVGSIWFDQVSAMPTDTYKGHGFRRDLIQMLLNLKPRFLRFPGASFVDGTYLRSAPRWKETLGPWEDRPGHYYDVWTYWSDDGLGFFEYLQLAEDLAAAPLWIVNAGVSVTDEVNSSFVGPFVQDMLDGVEFARGDINTSWGSLRAKYGHPEPFNLRHVAIGGESCGYENLAVYRGNYRKFYDALKEKYTDISVINSCDPTNMFLDDPADMFEYKLNNIRDEVFTAAQILDGYSRSRPKVAVSSYGATDLEHPNNTLIAALAEAEFLIGLERNSDVVSMANYAPLFNNIDYKSSTMSWTPNAIYFDTSRALGSPSYWVQSFFVESSGAFFLDLNQSGADNCTASAIRFRSGQNGKVYVKVKVVNMQKYHINMIVTFKGVDQASLKGSNQSVLTSYDPYDTNTFEHPNKVIPKSKSLEIIQNEWTTTLEPYSLTVFDLYIT